MAEEKNFENKIKRFIEAMGGWQVKYFANAYTKVGIPDILSCVNGNFIAVEVKASKGVPSPMQIHHLKQIDEAHGYAILLYPDMYEIFKKFLKKLCFDDVGEANRTYYQELRPRWEEYADELQ